MAGGSDLRPCELVEQQHRLLEGKVGIPYLREDGQIVYCRLQTRQLIKTDTGRVVPSKWVDAPVVPEVECCPV